MFARRHRELGELLCHRGLVTKRRWDEARTAAGEGRSAADLLDATGELPRARVLAAVAAELGRELVDAPVRRLEPAIAALVPAALARQHGVVPWRSEAQRLEVLLLDPFAAGELGELEFALGCAVRGCVADPAVVEALLREHYGEGAGALAAALVAAPEGAVATEPAGRELATQAAALPVVRYVDDVLEQAIRERASDIHFEPFEHECRVRCRIDGALREWPAPPAQLALPVASRLKVLANLDIAERRVPQDGRIQFAVAGRPVDLRVSTLPTQFGESVVLRVLDSERSAAIALDGLGLGEPLLAELRGVIRRPSGIVVVTGPTGSGKTSTLYACLRELNEAGAKLLTIEDPVEYELEGVTQVAVNPAAGLTFAAALRAFLRQDPDIVMVGEIRDLETAQVAIQAALTGHLVLTTLHTNDAAGAVTRLTDLGVEPYLVAASLEAVLAQRLVRCICPDCRCEQAADPEILERLTPPGRSLAGMRFFAGAGCPSCRGAGYRGRMGLFELLRVDEPMREQIARGAGTQELRDLALARGMETLRGRGLDAIAARATTPEEVLKYA